MQTKKAGEEFLKGFVTGSSLSLTSYFFFLLTASKANAVKPVGLFKYSLIAPKRHSRPLDESTKGLFTDGAGAICTAAIQSGDFTLGVACSFLLIIVGIIMNRS